MHGIVVEVSEDDLFETVDSQETEDNDDVETPPLIDHDVNDEG
eukprot:SAG31_NODE_26_length_32985_cov_39.054096_3_plen_43_part_00